MTNTSGTARELDERLLSGIDRASWRIVGTAGCFTA